MKMIRRPFVRRAFVRRPSRSILASSIVALAAPLLHAATFTWLDTNSGVLNWSAGAWSPFAPAIGDSAITTDLIFNGIGTTQYTANNNLASPFLLNTVTLNSTATVTETIGFGALSLNADGAAPAALTQSGSGAFTISSDLIAATPLALNGAGTGLLSLTGAISGPGLITKSSAGTVLLSNITSSYSGGTTITGGVLEVTTSVLNGNVDLPAAGGSVLGTGGVVTINGGELKISQNGTGSILSTAAARNFTFGASGGTLNLNGRIAPVAAATFSLTLTPGGVAPVVKFNGGPNGISSNNPTDGNWVIGAGNSLKFSALAGASATTPIIFEMTNGAMMDMISLDSFPGALTLRGVSLGTGGDATGQGIEKNTGRFVFNNGVGGVSTFASGLFLEDAVQLVSANATIRRIDANITARGTASGHAAQADISGRGTGTAITAPQGFPTVLGSTTNNGRTLTIENGGSVLLDNRNRTDQNNQNGVQVTALSDILGGGTLKVVQSWAGTGGIGGAARPVGYHEFLGDIRGSGTAASESVLEIQLPFRGGASAITNAGGVTFNAVGAAGTDLIVNGSNAGEGGGLRIAATPRNTRGYTANNGGSAGLAFADTGADNLAKLNADATNSIAAAPRLAALTGSGGYLTLAPTGATFPFPAGGEWANSVTVGLKVTDHNLTGDDVSLSTGFVHNINVTAGATLNAGGNTLGPAVATAGLGLVKGTGAITGGVTIAAGATLAPGFSIGTLTVGDITLNGTFQYEATSAPASDLLVVGGNLSLGITSTLSLPGGNTYVPADYTLATYSGTLSGTFGTVPALPANFTLSYGTGANSAIKLLFTTPTDVWDGTVSGAWNATAPNWKTLALFANLHKVLIDDTAAGPNTNIIINAGDVTPFNVTVNNGSVYANYSITGSAGNAIMGTGSLTKNGTGTLTLSGPHGYSGGTNVNNGTLRLGANDSLPNAGAVSVAATGVLDVNGMSDTVAALSVDGSVLAGNLTTTGAVTLGDGGSVAANLTLGGDVTKNGTAGASVSGTINLAGARTFTVAPGTAPELTVSGAISGGALTKSGNGTLKLGTAGVLDTVSGLAINAGTVDGNDTAISLSSLSGLAGGALNLGAGSLALAQSGVTTFAGNINGGTTVTKTLGGRITLSGSNNFSGGLLVSAGTVIAASFSAPGTGTVTVSPGAIFQVGASITNPIILQNATLASQGSPGQVTNNDLTAADGTTSTILLADSVNLGANSEIILLGTLRGGGNLNLVSGTANPAPDGGVGFRLRGGGASDFGGIITAGQSTKFEVQINNAVSNNPLGAGKVVLTAGTRLGNLNGTYSQFQTRITGAGETILFGNDFEIAGAGYVNYNALGGVNATANFGNLKIGGGQIFGFNKNDVNNRTVIFDSVTLTGGNAEFRLFDPGFTNSATPGGANLKLGVIGGAAGAGVIFNAQAPYVTTITGDSNYSGTTTVSTGTLNVGEGGTTGTLGGGAVTDNALIVFNRSDTLAVPNSITGTGTVTNAGGAGNVLDLLGAQDYAVLNANSGATHLHGAFTNGTATINVLATLGIGANQTVGALNVFDGAIVVLDSALPSPAPAEFGNPVQPVPEPGAMSLLLLGALGWLGRGRRISG